MDLFRPMLALYKTNSPILDHHKNSLILKDYQNLEILEIYNQEFHII